MDTRSGKTRVTDWVSACRNISVSGQRGWGRGRKTWMQCIEDDTRKQDPRGEDAQDRGLWRSGIM